MSTVFQRKYEFLRNVLLMLLRNKMILKRIEKELLPQNTIYLNIDSQYFEVAAAFKYEIVDGLHLNSLLDALRVNLSQLHTLLSLQLESGYAAAHVVPASRDAFVRDRISLMKSISDNLALLENTYQKR